MAINSYNNTSSLWIIINKGPKGGSLASLDPPLIRHWLGAQIDTQTLNSALQLHTHKSNAIKQSKKRIGGLMFGNQHT